MQQAMEAEYNESQMSAVTAGLDRSPVVLIQVCLSSLPQQTALLCPPASSINICMLARHTHALASNHRRNPPRGVVCRGPRAQGRQEQFWACSASCCMPLPLTPAASSSAHPLQRCQNMERTTSAGCGAVQPLGSPALPTPGWVSCAHYNFTIIVF